MPRAKRAKDAKFGNLIIFFATSALFARDIPSLDCGFVALGYLVGAGSTSAAVPRRACHK